MLTPQEENRNKNFSFENQPLITSNNERTSRNLTGRVPGTFRNPTNHSTNLVSLPDSFRISNSHMINKDSIGDGGSLLSMTQSDFNLIPLTKKDNQSRQSSSHREIKMDMNFLNQVRRNHDNSGEVDLMMIPNDTEQSNYTLSIA